MDELVDIGVDVQRYDSSRSADYRAVVFSKAYGNSDIALAADLKRNGVRVIFDTCDNHIYSETTEPALMSRLARLKEMVMLADAVVCSTPTLQREISSHFPTITSKITVIPDMLDPLESGQPAARWHSAVHDAWHRWRVQSFLARHRQALKLVWFGNHGVGHAQSGMSDLLQIKPILEDFARETPVSLTVVSNSYRKYMTVSKGWRLPSCYVPWRIGMFSEALKAHDVAIVPISRNPFTIAKTNNRPATAMMSGLGVIADSIPSYEELRPFIWLDDWVAGLRAYATQTAAEGDRMALGRNYLTDHYSARAIAREWQDLLLSDALRTHL